MYKEAVSVGSVATDSHIHMIGLSTQVGRKHTVSRDASNNAKFMELVQVNEMNERSILRCKEGISVVLYVLARV